MRVFFIFGELKLVLDLCKLTQENACVLHILIDLLIFT